VSADRAVSVLDRRALRAASLAALAEASVLCLPVHFVLAETAALRLGPPVLAVPFLVAYTFVTLLVCLFRGSAGVAAGVAAASVLAGLAMGGGDVLRISGAAVTLLVVAIRLVTLGMRDWGAPIGAEIAVWSIVLGVEAAIAAAGQPGWASPLVVLIPLFFGASLASRATTVWGAGADGAGGLDDAARSSWLTRAVLAVGGLVVGMILVVVVTVRGGLLDVIGEQLEPVFRAVVAGIVFVVVVVATPLAWLVERIGIDPEALRELLQQLRDVGPSEELQERARAAGPSPWGRLLGLLVLAAVGLLAIRVLRRLRPRASRAQPPLSGNALAVEPIAGRPERPGVARSLRELPVDAVRRRYAEALLVLRRRDLPKDPWLTPTEFVPVVTAAFPACGDDFRALTRAYEDVRYGGRAPDAELVRDLRRRHRRLRVALRAAGRDR
jgi:Domain of unknown function (DUF4129)